MAYHGPKEIAGLVEPDRVHRSLYTDPAIFELEMERIFKRVWTYVGHESQVKKPGDYWTVMIGRQPMIMIRGEDGVDPRALQPLPAPRRTCCSATAMATSVRASSAPTMPGVPTRRLAQGDPARQGLRGNAARPDRRRTAAIKRAPRIETYRGFVFASLADHGPSLLEWLGESRIAFDEMCDRSPEGEVEVVPTCFRIVQQSNWKFFLENQLDVAACRGHARIDGPRRRLEVEQEVKPQRDGAAPLDYHYLSAFAMPLGAWDEMQTINYPRGHGDARRLHGPAPAATPTRSPMRRCMKRHTVRRGPRISSTRASTT